MVNFSTFISPLKVRMASIAISAIDNDEGDTQSQRQFPSILAKDSITLHYGLRMDRNRRLTI